MIQVPDDKLFNFIGHELLTNYPRWSPEVRELEKLTDSPLGLGTLCRQVRVDQGIDRNQHSKSRYSNPTNKFALMACQTHFAVTTLLSLKAKGQHRLPLLLSY